ncbi:DUF402 domain-containing protein [Agromyces seonyuensis]|uniref:DUF402 domain-containing protein n=1 Tax=Agromyces seonyuensis TaxID=2662446 RepID=A0A6I4NZY8_9MICO|nr:DUF402 domain-containing protein [Agromyces seonyuensis]MWB98045.1 DUF402 domain-containing protein [Agromyces seonyuensis]
MTDAPIAPDALDLVPGEQVLLRFRKYDGGRHWEAETGVWLGRDAHGFWVGFPEGTYYERPGRSFTAGWGSVSLFPAAGWAATFNRDHDDTEVYVDLTSEPELFRDADGVAVAALIDLDLDVLRLRTGEHVIVDQDELVEHRELFGYPDELVAKVEADADAVLAAARAGEAPFDAATPAHWFAVLDGLVGR